MTNTSEYSNCYVVQENNTDWTKALTLDLTQVSTGTVGTEKSQYIDIPGQSRWFKFSIQPGDKVVINLEDSPVNFDLVAFNDIEKAYKELAGPEDLAQLGAEQVTTAFSNPAAFLIRRRF